MEDTEDLKSSSVFGSIDEDFQEVTELNYEPVEKVYKKAPEDNKELYLLMSGYGDDLVTHFGVIGTKAAEEVLRVHKQSRRFRERYPFLRNVKMLPEGILEPVHLWELKFGYDATVSGLGENRTERTRYDAQQFSSYVKAGPFDGDGFRGRVYFVLDQKENDELFRMTVLSNYGTVGKFWESKIQGRLDKGESFEEITEWLNSGVSIFEGLQEFVKNNKRI